MVFAMESNEDPLRAPEIAKKTTRKFFISAKQLNDILAKEDKFFLIKEERYRLVMSDVNMNFPPKFRYSFCPIYEKDGNIHKLLHLNLDEGRVKLPIKMPFDVNTIYTDNWNQGILEEDQSNSTFLIIKPIDPIKIIKIRENRRENKSLSEMGMI
jgi:hypothetical protein